jgi:hypothetical protein
MSDRRPQQSDCQTEPHYPGADTVVFSFRSPEWLCHDRRPDCPHEGPHRFNDCGAA